MLLYKGKATLDVAEKKVLVVDIPRLGSVKAASAALGLFIVGAILLIVPLWLADNWRKERTGLTNEIEKLKAESYKTVTIQGPVKSDRFPVVIYAASKLTALETEGAISPSPCPSVSPSLFRLRRRFFYSAQHDHALAD